MCSGLRLQPGTSLGAFWVDSFSVISIMEADREIICKKKNDNMENHYRIEISNAVVPIRIAAKKFER